MLGSTPARNLEIALAGRNCSLSAIDPKAADKMDLLSVVEQELRRIAGLGDLSGSVSSVMSGTLQGSAAHPKSQGGQCALRAALSRGRLVDAACGNLVVDPALLLRCRPPSTKPVFPTMRLAVTARLRPAPVAGQMQSNWLLAAAGCRRCGFPLFSRSPQTSPCVSKGA